MSRTDAHTPWWTRAPWLEPVHSIYCELYIARGWQGGISKRACDLPESAERAANKHKKRGDRPCTWEPVWPRYRDMHKLFGNHVPHWFIRHVWNGPERVRQRAELGRMIKEFNATGELEDGDYANYQTRHMARWLWD